MFKKILQRYTVKKPDMPFLVALGVLVIFGLLVLASASAPVSFQRFGESYYFLRHQIMFGLIPGLILFTIFSLIDYRVWKKFAPALLVFSIVLLVLVFIPGVGAEFGTARSWIHIFGISLQPSEIVKLTFLVYLATWLESRGHQRAGHLHEGLLPFLMILGIIMFLMLMQPDTGSMGVIVAMAMAVYFVGGAAIKHVVAMGGIGIFLLFLLIKLTPYRAARFMIFLHPELDPQGAGYHINQAFLAIGSGGLFGRGFGLSRQKHQYLPEVIGDSIFAILAEELGFLFGVIVVGLFVFLMYRGIQIAMATKDLYGRYLVVGIITWITTQAFVNMGAMAGVLPLTGVTLPFISYGGTSLTVSLWAMGIVTNISRHANLTK